MDDEILMPAVTNRRKVFGLITIFLLIIYLLLIVRFNNQAPHLALIMGTITASIFAAIDGTKWNIIEKGMFQSIMMAMQAIIILLVIGMLIASWLSAGIVQAMIYYGLNIINPQFFFISALFLSSIVALSTGSSWTTAGTVGIALIGIAAALNINLAMAAGAIVSGAYFGDKMSPLSDTTNLAPAIAGTNLFDHIKSMLYTTIPSYIIAAIIYLIMGFVFIKNGNSDISQIKEIQNVLASAYNINLFLLIPPLLIIIMIIFKIPALPGLVAATFLGIFFSIIMQGQNDFKEIISTLHYGYTFDGSKLANADMISKFFTEHQLISNNTFYEGMTFFTKLPSENQTFMDVSTSAINNLGFKPQILLDVKDLLSRGGFDSMLGTVSLILCAMTFSGVMEASGMLVSLVDSLKVLTKKRYSLAITSIMSGLATNILAADQYVSIVLPGRMFKQAFKNLNLAPRVQSRILESGGTLTSPLVPWNTCGATMSQFLGVNSLAFAPFAFFNLINPLIEIIAAAIGWAMFEDDGSDHVK